MPVTRPGPLHWIMVQVLELLQHGLVAQDGLRVNAFLPDLMLARRLMRGAVGAELVQEPRAALDLELRENLARGELLQITYRLRQVWPGDDGMEVVIEDHPSVEFQAFVLAAVGEGADKDVAAGGGGEDGEPLDDRGGDEVRRVRFVDAVAAAPRQSLAETEFRGQVRSQTGVWERGKIPIASKPQVCNARGMTNAIRNEIITEQVDRSLRNAAALIPLERASGMSPFRVAEARHWISRAQGALNALTISFRAR